MEDFDDHDDPELRLLARIEHRLERLVDLLEGPLRVDLSINGEPSVATTIVLKPGTPKEN